MNIYPVHTLERFLLNVERFQYNYCLVGHSERRQYYNEIDASVAAKTVCLLSHGITPIVCIGESKEERESGKTDEVLVKQIISSDGCCRRYKKLLLHTSLYGL